jgi:hypothetical protein
VTHDTMSFRFLLPTFVHVDAAAADADSAAAIAAAIATAAGRSAYNLRHQSQTSRSSNDVNKTLEAFDSRVSRPQK